MTKDNTLSFFNRTDKAQRRSERHCQRSLPSRGASLQMLRQYAAEHGLTVVDEYIDDGWSGTNFERPSFQRMIDDIEDGKINCVVTKDYCAIIGLNQKDLENQGILA